jgi:polar amino acid transport system permease protein
MRGLEKKLKAGVGRKAGSGTRAPEPVAVEAVR